MATTTPEGKREYMREYMKQRRKSIVLSEGEKEVELEKRRQQYAEKRASMTEEEKAAEAKRITEMRHENRTEAEWEALRAYRRELYRNETPEQKVATILRRAEQRKNRTPEQIAHEKEMRHLRYLRSKGQ
jgi:hypothetical protein